MFFCLHRLRRGDVGDSGDPPDGILRDYFFAFLDAQDDACATLVFTEINENLKNSHAIWMFKNLIQPVKMC